MTAASPFAPYQNFRAAFEVQGDTLVTDTRGNIRPQSVAVEVVALMEQKSAPKDGKERAGVDSSAIYLVGYLVSPRPLPTRITPESPCVAVFNGIRGRFVMEFTARNPYLAALAIDLVDELKGYFQPGSWVPENAEGLPGVEYELSFTDATLVAGVLTVTHGLNTYPSAVAVWDNVGDLVVTRPQYVNANQITIDLSGFQPLVGNWRVSVSK